MIVVQWRQCMHVGPPHSATLTVIMGCYISPPFFPTYHHTLPILAVTMDYHISPFIPTYHY